MFQFIFALIVALVLQVVSYLLTPKPKPTKPEAVKDMEDPTAEAGRPMSVIFGQITVKGGNILWYGDKRTEEVNV